MFIFHLKNQYVPHIEEQRTFIEGIPSQEDIIALEVIQNILQL